MAVAAPNQTGNSGQHIWHITSVYTTSMYITSMSATGNSGELVWSAFLPGAQRFIVNEVGGFGQGLMAAAAGGLTAT